MSSEIEERIILESILLALREIVQTLESMDDRAIITQKEIEEARADVDKINEQIARILEKLHANNDGKASSIKAFGDLPARAQFFILATAALLAASGWLSRLLGG